MEVTGFEKGTGGGEGTGEGGGTTAYTEFGVGEGKLRGALGGGEGG